MYKCFNCGEYFDEPDYRNICLESYFGVASQFDNYNYREISLCPYCGSEDIEEVYDDYEYEE